MDSDFCDVPGCSRPIEIRKRRLCSGHNLQRHNGKSFTTLPPIDDSLPCPVEGCLRRVRAKGLCTSHAAASWRWSINPEELVEVLNARRCQMCGPGVSTQVVIDHDHSCCPGNYSCGGCLRGPLCRAHNLLVGYVELGRARSPEAELYLSNAPYIKPSQYRVGSVDSHKGRGTRI